MLSDEALVKRSLRDGSQHFGELVKRYSDYLFGFTMRLTGGHSAVAEDLSQQSFIRAFKYLTSFDVSHGSAVAKTDHRFRNWLTGIAANCFNGLVALENHYRELAPDLEPT